MTERQFTPPTTFPTEYKSAHGHKCVILAQDPSGGFVGYIVSGSKWWSREWDANGWFGLKDTGPDLHDIAKVTSTWQNIYAQLVSTVENMTRASADRRAMDHRIAVLRLDTIDGVTTAHMEDL